MAKVKLPLPPDPNDWWMPSLLHVGDLGPGADRAHLLWVYHLTEAPLFTSWTWPWPSEELAWSAAQHLAREPNLLQDLCADCHWWGWRRWIPRWNIQHNGTAAILTPAYLDNWYP